MISHSKKLMEARLGVYEKPPYQGVGVTEGVDNQATRLHASGGYS